MVPYSVLLFFFRAQSAFGQVEIIINDVPVNSQCAMHHHRAFILNSVNYTSYAKNSHLSLAGYRADGPDPTNLEITTVGMYDRGVETENGKVVVAYGKLSHDLVSLTRVLPVGKSDLPVLAHCNTTDTAYL